MSAGRAARLAALALAALLAAASSSDPNGSAVCVTGHASEDGPVCTALDRPVVVDGDPSEFAAEDVQYIWESSFVGPCLPDECYLMWLKDGDSLVFHGRRYGPDVPTDAISLLFANGDYDVAESEDRLIMVLFNSQFVRVFIDDYELYNVPVEVAYTAQGFEVRVPLALLSYGNSALVDRLGWTLQGDQWTTPGQMFGWLGYACWDASAEDNPCTLF